MIRKLIRKLLLVKQPPKELAELKMKLAEFENHIFQNALMKDIYGNTGEGRNKETTGQHWDRYHLLSHELREKIAELEKALK